MKDYLIKKGNLMNLRINERVLKRQKLHERQDNLKKTKIV